MPRHRMRHCAQHDSILSDDAGGGAPTAGAARLRANLPLIAQLLCSYFTSIDIWFDGFQCLWCLLRIGSSYNQWHTTDTEGGSAVAMVLAYVRAA